ncbi:type IV toxin-antitoxin system YeeU family antitoxin [Lelliottia wanjuensis]|uniref:type IV toxin-antitoxin system YeeU family antitoxin n=1 Tax=Lelliottia wanjuensis TaxID=3050585 RepID=UPI002550F29E|nr:type IV toxin-antitoxin system YeeU family antitoxin [Lelliottia sp. V86_10]MDK9584316.1 type IV toxin-antitoxin system YeeU family antitoxin [Lelliottia sp. V86_10]
MPEINPPGPVWSLRHDITPAFGARLVQEGPKLHFLADRATLSGEFTPEQCEKLDATFPLFIARLEVALHDGRLDPRRSTRITDTVNGLTCEADTRGSCGYVYLTIYPA